MERESIFIGIDVAKEKVDIDVCPSDRTWSTSYDDDDVEALVGQLQELSPTAMVLEATGGIELPLVAALAAASLPVAVINPRQVRDFAKSRGQLAKTDRLDARVLAHFGEAVRPSTRPLRDAETQILSAVLARRRQVSSIITAEKNRLAGPYPRSVHAFKLISVGWSRNWTSWTTTCGEPSGTAQYGGRRTNYCAVFPECRQSGVHHAAGRPAGTGHTGPETDRRLGWSCPLQPGQRAPSRQAHRMGWPCPRSGRAVYGGTGRQSLEPGDPRLLSAAAGRRQAEEAGPDSLHAEAVDHT